MTVYSKRIKTIIFTAALPAFHSVISATEHEQIVVPDNGQNHVTLDPGDSVVYRGASSGADTGAAITVTGPDASFEAHDVTVSAVGTTPNFRSSGIVVDKGGKAQLSDSAVSISPTNQNASALSAKGQGSEITANNVDLSTSGDYSYATNASNGGKITLNGGAITTNGLGVSLYATDTNSTVLADGVKISSISGVVSVNSGGLIILKNSSVEVGTTPGIAVLRSVGIGSRLELQNTAITSGRNASVIWAEQGGHVDLDGVTVHLNNGPNGIFLSAPRYSTGSTASIRNTQMVLSNTTYGLNLNGDYASATLENSSIEAKQGAGAWLIGANTSLNAKEFSIVSRDFGINSRGGGVILENGSITTLGNDAHALSLSVDRAGAAGAVVNNRASLTLDSSQLNTS